MPSPRAPWSRQVQHKPSTPGAPQALPRLLTAHESPAHRAFGCVFYDACLDVAASEGWTSFSCRSCPKAEGLEAEPAPELEQADDEVDDG